MKTRVSSFVDKAMKLLDGKQQKKAVNEIEKGLKHYSNRIVQGINPFPPSDAAIVISSLRALADKIEAEHPASVPLTEYIMKNTAFNQAPSVTKHQKPNTVV